MIQQIVNETNQMIQSLHEAGKLDKRVLAVGIEINQRYVEYLEQLEHAPLQVYSGVRILVDGQVIEFKNADEFSAWLAENL